MMMMMIMMMMMMIIITHRYVYPQWKKNTCLKTVAKLSKYKDLEIEIEITWKLKTMTVPVPHRCSRASHKGDWKLHQQGPGKH